MPDPRSHEQESLNQVWPESRFVGYIVASTAGRPIRVSEIPDKIDLTGKIGSACDYLQAQTKDREMGIVYFIDGDLKHPRLIPGEIVTGEKTEIAMKIRAGETAFKAHTHPIDRPFSPQDFVSVLLRPEEGGATASTIITPSINMLLLRNENTPKFSRLQAQIEMEPHSEYLRGLYDFVFGHLNLVADDYINTSFETRQNIDLVLKICDKYHLILYTSMLSRGRNLYIKTSA